METILKHTNLDQTLAKEGYVVVPFLDSEKVEQLTSFFHEHHPDTFEGFYATAHVPDIAFRKKMNERIKAAFLPEIEKHFINCTPLGGSFVVKSNQNNDKLQPHQDWNIVDETQYRSFNIWVPLVDLTEENGAITVIPKSHLWYTNHRGPNIIPEYKESYEELWTKMQPLYLKAGEALVYDHRLFHASYANTSNQYRIAAVFGIKPSSAEMFYYYGNNGKVEVYKSNVDFFMEGDIQRGNEVLERVGGKPLKGIQRQHGFWKKLLNRYLKKGTLEK